MDTITLKINPARLKYVLGITAVTVLLPCSIFFGRNWVLSSRLSTAEAHLRNGFHSLAVEALDTDRHTHAKTAAGCSALIQAYTGAHNSDRLLWAVESCLNNKVQCEDIYSGLAQIQMLWGNKEKALEVAREGQEKHPNSPKISAFYIALLSQLERKAEAVRLAQEASIRFHDDFDIQVLALSLLAQADRWEDARGAAERLKPFSDRFPPILKSLVAKALDSRPGQQAAALAVAKDNVAGIIKASKFAPGAKTKSLTRVGDKVYMGDPRAEMSVKR